MKNQKYIGKQGPLMNKLRDSPPLLCLVAELILSTCKTRIKRVKFGKVG